MNRSVYRFTTAVDGSKVFNHSSNAVDFNDFGAAADRTTPINIKIIVTQNIMFNLNK